MSYTTLAKLKLFIASLSSVDSHVRINNTDFDSIIRHDEGVKRLDNPDFTADERKRYNDYVDMTSRIYFDDIKDIDDRNNLMYFDFIVRLAWSIPNHLHNN